MWWPLHACEELTFLNLEPFLLLIFELLNEACGFSSCSCYWNLKAKNALLLHANSLVCGAIMFLSRVPHFQILHALISTSESEAP
ncbi:hypothetical protein VNO77_32071 [Canavalia gladiata]|uniref:Uncharacterized protein n=1 Tax=Canavalia gladiata TaxID=3824 RepID=A0AAN9KSB3_CANGL